MPEKIEVVIDVCVKISLWEAFKLRLAGLQAIEEVVRRIGKEGGDNAE